MKTLQESILGKKSVDTVAAPEYISATSDKGKKIISNTIKNKGICFIDCGPWAFSDDIDDIIGYIYRVAKRNKKKVIHLDSQAGTLKVYGKSRAYPENIPSNLNDYIEYHNREWYGDGIIDPKDDLVIFIDGPDHDLFKDTVNKPDWMNNSNSIIILADRNDLFNNGKWLFLHNNIDHYLSTDMFKLMLNDFPQDYEYDQRGFRTDKRGVPDWNARS